MDIESQNMDSKAPEPVTPSPRQQPVNMPGSLNLAAIMASNDSLAIFRKFSDLGMLNILCLQEELTHLRRRLFDLISPEGKNDLNYDRNPFDNQNLIDFDALIQDGQSPERKLLNEIRIKLKEYSEYAIRRRELPLSCC